MLEAIQRGEQRPGLDLKRPLGHLLDPAGDAEAVQGFEVEDLQHQEVE